MVSVTTEELQRLVAQYRSRFGAGPPTWESVIRLSEETASLIKSALETGTPIPGWEPGEETSLRGRRHAGPPAKQQPKAEREKARTNGEPLKAYEKIDNVGDQTR